MILQSIALENFRNYSHSEFSFSPEVNILCGENGKGKTNLLEAIWLFTGVRSWRTAKRSELIRWEQQKASCRASVLAHERDYTLQYEIPFAGRTQVTVNGIRKQKQLELSDYLRCVLFSPEDLALVKGAPGERRAFLDSAICQLRPRYGELISRYECLLQNKSKLLRGEIFSLDLLGVFNAQLAVLGAQIIGYRAKFCRGLEEEAGKIHFSLSGEKERMELCYETVSAVTDPFAPAETVRGQLEAHLKDHLAAEQESKSCLSGVHRDDLLICINGKPARAFASQGQARSAALALKFAQRALFYRDTGEYPLLLLDDVLSELDGARQRFVAGHTLGGQTIITCCEDKTGFSGAVRMLL